MAIEKIERILNDLIHKSQQTRDHYLEQCDLGASMKPQRASLSCTNLAHSYAAAEDSEKMLLRQAQISPNLGIVTAYNDMLSAHQPYYRYPEMLKTYALKHGATAQVAGGTPAMCDGVTQGQPGMELSLFSRDVIALSTAIALSHNTFDAAMYLGICDKIVPGLLMGALAFGHLPGIFIPSGPMSTGMSNDEKAKVRVDYVEGKIGKDVLLASEEKSYHSKGTCTFYGTANSNQVLLEMMGIQLPGSAFVPPNTPLRDNLNDYAVKLSTQQCLKPGTGLGYILDAKNILNAVIGLLATGGSTNHTLHLVAIARTCGWQLTWEHIADLSDIIPLVTKLYPNGKADVNEFQKNGATPAVIATLMEHDLLFDDIQTSYGLPFSESIKLPSSNDTSPLVFQNTDQIKKDPSVFRAADAPFSATGGLQLLNGNLGQAIIKVSSLSDQTPSTISAPVIVFSSQLDIVERYMAGELNKDFIAVLPGQGPSANGMPELHQLTPPLTSLQSQGFKIALVTDGRMSGASGKFPAAIHLTPEAANGGLIGKLKTGDQVTIDLNNGTINADVSSQELANREPFKPNTAVQTFGRVLFARARQSVSPANQGASFIV